MLFTQSLRLLASRFEVKKAMKEEYAAIPSAYNGIQNVKRATVFAISPEYSNRKHAVWSRTNDDYISI
jgi:hypothetical protein